MTQSCASIRIYYDRLLYRNIFFFCSPQLIPKVIPIERKVGDDQSIDIALFHRSTYRASFHHDQNQQRKNRISFSILDSFSRQFDNFNIFFYLFLFRAAWEELLLAKQKTWEYSRKRDIYRDEVSVIHQVGGDIKYFPQKSVSGTIGVRECGINGEKKNALSRFPSMVCIYNRD